MSFGNFSDDELDEIGIDNKKKKNPPQFDAGMGDEFSFGGDSFGGEKDAFGDSGFGADPFASSDGFGTDPFGSSSTGGGGFGDAFGSAGGSSFGGSGFGGGFNDTPKTNDKSTEDKIFDGAKVATKETFTFLKLAITAYKSQTRIQWITMYRTAMYASTGLSVIAVVLMIFGVKGLDILTGSLLTLGASVYGFMHNVDKAGKEEQQGIDIGRGKVTGEPVNTELSNNQNNSPFGDEFGGGTSGFGDGGFGGFGDSSFGDKDGFEGFEGFDEEITDDLDSALSEQDDLISGYEPKSKKKEDEYKPKKSREERLDDMEDVKVISRSFLLDNFSDILEEIQPDYDKATKLDEDDREFRKWAIVVKKSAEIFAPSNVEEDDMPILISVEERLFYYYLVVERVKWLKDIQKFINEIVSYYAFDDDKGELDENVYGKGTASGDKLYIKIMRSENTMIGLKDIYDSNYKSIKDKSNKLPIVLGVTEEGEAVIEDFEKVNSILIAGEPRSGKSVLSKTILVQMMALNSPEELEFYIYDTKGKTSDFLKIDIPHVKEFESDVELIVRKIQKLIDVEAVKRTDMLAEAGEINILDYNKKNPDKKMPFLYVVIDEVVSLVNSMDNDLKREFQEALAILITRTPNLGIRLFMIPHILHNDIVKKQITSNIPCRISVRGNESHIEGTTNATYKDFPYKLRNVGDLAVKMTNGKPKFVKACVTAPDEDKFQEVVDYLRKMWLKLMPDSIEGSYYQKRLKEAEGITDSIGESKETQPKKQRNIEIVPPNKKQEDSIITTDEQDEMLDDFWKNV